MTYSIRPLAVAALLAVAGASQAVTLVPGTFVALPGTTVATEPQLAGVVLVDLSQPFSFSAYGGTVSGRVQSRVVRSEVDGTLDFYWRVFNDANSAGAIQDLRVGRIISPEYNANWRIDGLGDKGPSVAYLFPEGAALFPGSMNFRFFDSSPSEPGAGLLPGETSKFILLDTSAVNYARTGLYDLSNFGQSANSALFETFAPAPIPEPGTWALMALGLASLAARARRRG